MSNPTKYIKDLEATGFQRNQAEAQVQFVLDMLEGDLVTKSEFAIYQEKLENRFAKIDRRFDQIDDRFEQLEKNVQNQIKESEFRTLTRLGLLNVSTITIAVAILTWLIKVH